MAFNTVALIVAAGHSSRMGDSVPKPYMELGGLPVLRRIAQTFLAHSSIDAVQVVIRPEDEERYQHAMKDLATLTPVHGGVTRHESVRKGLERLREYRPERVLVHDAARPLASASLINRVMEGLAKHAAVVPCIPVQDALKHVREGQVEANVKRDYLYYAQTPQGFWFESLLKLHQTFSQQNVADDAALMELANTRVHTVPGEKSNIKLTTKDDLDMMQMMLGITLETRVGMGFDAHRLHRHQAGIGASKFTMMLCGMGIPSDYYLEGHSDGDVGIHAIVDALLGALGEGDIGEHFSPQDIQWKGAESAQFLTRAGALVKRRQGEIVHLDLTVICEKPRIAPYREAMRQRVADILEIPASRVSIKATTTEQMGFTGRAEGIAAQAVATLRLPAAA